jgi:alanine-synthesizing transaminase
VFSARAGVDLAPNRLSAALAKLREEGTAFADLTLSNPTRAAFDYPDDLLTGLADPRGLVYDPAPFGLASARECVSVDYARRGVAVRPDRIVLTASTSEAYSFLFKLVADPGDEVLVPRPSYPLIAHLARLDAVAAREYDLEYHGAWSIDFDSVERGITDRTRALLVVSPNNPTGSFVTGAELDRLAALCAPRHIAIITDEVFADYELTPGANRRAGRPLDPRDVLSFSLGGLSKSAGLPQAKLAWIAAAGPEALVRSSLARLELVCDTYLSVSTPVQASAAELLTRGALVRDQIQTRVSGNYRALLSRAAATPACGVLTAGGGWYAVVRVPSIQPEEELVVSLLANERVLTHPGYFYDFPREAFLVISLLVPGATFEPAIDRIFRHFDCRAVAGT